MNFQSRRLREEYMKLQKQQQFNYGYANKAQLELQEQIAQRLEIIAQHKRKYHEKLEHAERIRNAERIKKQQQLNLMTTMSDVTFFFSSNLSNY